MPCAVEIASEYRYRNPVVPAELAVRHDLAVGRDGRHAGRAAAGKAVGLPLDARDLQRAGELAGARIGAGDADARGPGDRRRLDQGVHHAARGARHAGGRARAPSRRATPSASATWSTRLIELPGLVERTLELDPVDPAPGRAIRRQAPRAVPRPRRAATPSRWKGRSSSRKSPTSTPRPTLPASSSTAARAGGRRHAGRHGRAEQRTAREAQIEPAGSARARRRAVSCSPTPSPGSKPATA